jgi:hypothetical protein
MFAATTRPWYLPTWVSCQTPLTSPIARAQARVDWNPAGMGFDAHGFQRDAQTAFGECTGAVLARRAAADDDNVVVAAHDGSGLPPCSANMYSAYQLGQSASR